MISPGEMAARIRSLIDDLESNKENELQVIGRDMLALIKRRVQNSGTDADGNQYSKYSDTKLPSYFYADHPRYDEVKKKNKENNYKGVSYMEYRELRGMPIEYKNFTLSGDMFRSMQVQIEDDTIVILPIRDEELKKLEWNEDRDGKILKLSDKEKNLTKNAIQERLRQKLIEHGII